MKNSVHSTAENPNWILENSLNSSKPKVWAARGHAGIDGSFFFKGNVDSELYLKVIEAEFYPEFCNLQRSSQLISCRMEHHIIERRV